MIIDEVESRFEEDCCSCKSENELEGVRCKKDDVGKKGMAQYGDLIKRITKTLAVLYFVVKIMANKQVLKVFAGILPRLKQSTSATLWFIFLMVSGVQFTYTQIYSSLTHY